MIGGAIGARAPSRHGGRVRWTIPMEMPYLSIIVTGRNDDFGGDFNGRFFRALHFNHEQLTAAGVAHEFVFVEWRPISGRPLLATLLGAAFPSLSSAHLRSYVVDASYHDAISLNPRLQFQEFIAKNVGIRRARGQFLLTTNTDIYLSRGVIERLAAGALDAKTLYRAARHDLKSNSDVSWIDWDLLEDDRNWEIVNQIKPPLFTNASGDFLLLDRDSYHRLRGFNEIYRTAKIHIDGNFCVKALSSGVPLVDIGAPVYHVGRGTLHAQVGAYRNRPDEAPWGDIRWNSDVIYVNGPEWGLGNAPERAIDERIIALDFDWEAVGPMVDLKRVVLPSARRS
jgi:hypothetical protein